VPSATRIPVRIDVDVSTTGCACGISTWLSRVSCSLPLLWLRRLGLVTLPRDAPIISAMLPRNDRWLTLSTDAGFGSARRISRMGQQLPAPNHAAAIGQCSKAVGVLVCWPEVVMLSDHAEMCELRSLNCNQTIVQIESAPLHEA
jgi:hypothetical protein